MSAKIPKPLTFFERRRVPRFPVRQSLTVKWPDNGMPSWGGDPEFLVQPATCRDISSSGVYLWVQQSPGLGAEIEVLLQAPPELIPHESVNMSCRGRVVRIESDLNFGRIGLAVAFDHVQTTKRAA
jgi:hypothetical protein